MDAEATPPVVDEVSVIESKPIARWRWWVHLSMLTLMPALVGVLGLLRHQTTALLPGTVRGLLWVSLYEWLYPALFFALAWLASRANASQMLLPWRGGVKPVLWGFAYSIALRLVIAVVLIMVIVVWMIVAGNHAQNVDHFRAQTENLVDGSALAKDPVYFVLCLTLVSFVVAGLREELWRAGMFAGCRALFPAQFAKWPGQVMAVVMVGVMFGLAHTSQGAAGVGATIFLGIGLGAIMLWHRSIWEAVIAHGFFDATTFAFLFLLAKYYPELMHKL